MKKVMFKFSLLSLLVSSYSHAFNGSKCWNNYVGPTYGFGLPFSTSSYVSSTGDCALIGLAPKEQSKLFYAQNFDKLQEDAARGDGEYLQTLAYMNGCAGKRYERLGVHIKNNYRSLMMVDAEKSYSLIEDKLNNCQ